MGNRENVMMEGTIISYLELWIHVCIDKIKIVWLVLAENVKKILKLYFV